MNIDAASLRRLLYDLIKFNPKDFFVTASPTGFHVGLATPRPRNTPSACASDPEHPTYTLTFPSTPMDFTIANNIFIFPTPTDGTDGPDGGWFAGCVWQWVGDASGGSGTKPYDNAGPDVLSLGRFLDPGDSTVKWGIRFSTITDPTSYGTDFIDVDDPSPVGSYNSGLWEVS